MMRYPSAPASLIDPSGSFYQAYAEASGSPSPYGGGLRRRTGEREDRCTQSAGGVDSTRFAAKPEHRERDYFRAICAGDGFSVRATGIVSQELRMPGHTRKVRLPAFITRSAALPADASSLRGGFLPALRCWLKILRAVKVARHLLSPLVNRFQQATSSITYPFGSFASAVFHDRNLAKDHEHEVQRNQAIGA